MRSLTSLTLIALMALHVAPAASLPQPAFPETLAQANPPASLPEQVRDRLLQKISQIAAVPIAELTITDYQAANWSDSCLGLGGPAEICAAVITPGWFLEVTDGDHTWQYRTNADGTHLRQAAMYGNDATLSDEPPVPFLSDLALHITSEYDVAPETLNLEAIERTTWDGCYGLPSDTPCARTEIPGARIVISAPGYVWVYHTDLEGSTFRLNAAASQINQLTLSPTFISPEELPVLANPIPETLFSVIIDRAGSRYQLSVYGDRSVAGYQWTRADRWAAVDLGSIPYRDFFELRDLLANGQFSGLHGLSYGVSPDGNTTTYTLVGGPENWVIQYDPALINQLPTKLKQLIILWDSLGLERR